MAEICGRKFLTRAFISTAPNIRNIPYPNFFIPLFVSILFPPVFYICVVFNLAADSAVIISLSEKNKETQVRCICADIEPHLQSLNLHR